MVTPFQGIGGTSLQGSVTYVLRICVTDVLRRFCYLCPGAVQLARLQPLGVGSREPASGSSVCKRLPFNERGAANSNYAWSAEKPLWKHRSQAPNRLHDQRGDALPASIRSRPTSQRRNPTSMRGAARSRL